MKIVLTISLLVALTPYLLYAQKKVNVTGAHKYLEVQEGKKKREYKVEYYEAIKKYRLCEGNDKALRPVLPNQIIGDDCDCDGHVGLPTAFNEMDENYLKKYEFLKNDKSENKWILELPESQTVSGSDVNEYAFLKKIVSENSSNTLDAVNMSPNNTCAIDHVEKSDVMIYMTKHPSNAKNIVDKICAVNGNLRSSSFELCSAPVNGATAVFDKKRYILYNENYLKKTRTKTKTDWITYFIFAHEVAHHLNGDMLVTNNAQEYKNNELSADKWAGFALHMLGAPRKQTLAWVRKSNNSNDPLYPSQKDRIAAVKTGWDNLSGISITNKFWLSVGGTTEEGLYYRYYKDSSVKFNADTNSVYNHSTIDVFIHPPIGKILPHFAIGGHYGVFDWEADGPWAFSIKAYAVNYFTNDMNVSLCYTIGNFYKETKVGLNYMAFSKRMNFEISIGKANFDDSVVKSDRSIFVGLSVHYCFLNNNLRTPKLR